MTVQATYTVAGMTCAHCVASVTEEISELPGVREVQVDLARGSVSVVSSVPLEEDLLRAAVADAGYELR